MRVPDKEENVPRLAPACLIGCAAYVGHYDDIKITKSTAAN